MFQPMKIPIASTNKVYIDRVPKRYQKMPALLEAHTGRKKTDTFKGHATVTPYPTPPALLPVFQSAMPSYPQSGAGSTAMV
jgi:hypothetical protein